MKLSLEEKQYLYGLLENALYEEKKLREAQGEYPFGKATGTGHKRPSQSELIRIYQSIYSKV